MKLELLEYVHDNLPNGFKPYYIYLMIVEGCEVGKIVLREGSDEDMYYSGHIGYSVYKEFRGHHYAYEACLLLKEYVDRDYLLITCDPDNYPSLKTIHMLGCEYIEIVSIPKELKKVFTEDEKEKMIFKWKLTS
ncbi:MAG: GNAT family N-acetyltransferase [Coprobacillus sp.]